MQALSQTSTIFYNSSTLIGQVCARLTLALYVVYLIWICLVYCLFYRVVYAKNIIAALRLNKAQLCSWLEYMMKTITATDEPSVVRYCLSLQ